MTIEGIAFSHPELFWAAAVALGMAILRLRRYAAILVKRGAA